MDIQKVTSGVTAAAVVGTGAFVGGNHQIDKMQGGPQKRQDAQIEKIRQVCNLFPVSNSRSNYIWMLHA